MFTKSLLLLLVVAYVQAFSPVATPFKTARTAALNMAVVDIDSEAAFDKTIQSAGDSLVVVDYSTTWCGPCKVRSKDNDEDLELRRRASSFVQLGGCLCYPCEMPLACHENWHCSLNIMHDLLFAHCSSLLLFLYLPTTCQVIAPKFDELSEKYTDAVFLKVRRWSCDDQITLLPQLVVCNPNGMPGKGDCSLNFYA